MKKSILALALLVCADAFAQYNGSALAELEDSETTAAMREHVGFFSSAMLEGRKAGSEGEKEAAAYFSGVLEEYGVDLLTGEEGDIFGIRQENGDTLTSRNVVGFIPGYDPALRERYIVVGARLDNLGTISVTKDGVKETRICYGANGNGSGLAMLLQLARMLNTNSVLLRRSVLVVAFGASAEMNAGAWYFLNRSFKGASEIDAMVNLDMVGTGSNGFYAYSGSNADMNAIARTLSSTLQPVQPKVVAIEPVASDHRAFYDKGIPSVMFTTGMYPEYNTSRDTGSIVQYGDMERELEYVYNYTLALANGPKPEFNPTESLRAAAKSTDNVVPYFDCDRKPVFLGSSEPAVFLKKWVYVYLRYPEEAVRQGIQGRVLVDFVIDEKGKVRDVKVARGVHSLLDEEAVRVISASPDWKPGRLRGQKVKTRLSVYVEFRLERRK